MQQRTENNRGGWTDLTRERTLLTMGSQGGLFFEKYLNTPGDAIGEEFQGEVQSVQWPGGGTVARPQ